MINFMKKQYSFLTEAFYSDYHRNTIGEFKLIAASDIKKKLVNDAKRLHFIPDHYSKSGSIYLVSPDKTKLIRISDHWSDSNIPGVKKCGRIGSCVWFLIGDQKIPVKEKFQAGIVDIIKLRKI